MSEKDDRKDKYLEEDNYFQIDGKNTFSIGDNEESKEKLNNILDDNKEFFEENEENLKKTLSLFYEKIYKTDSDPFNICYTISKHLRKTLNINRDIIDEKLQLIINKKKDYKYSKKIKINKENTGYLGYILSYAYSKFSYCKISNGKELKAKADKAKKDQVDVITLFYADCFNQSKPQDQCSKTLFCKKNKSNFILPGVFIMLMNALIYINTIEINFNFEEEDLTKDEVNLFIISILNIQYIFPNKINIKLNMINEKLQCLVYRRFYKELLLNTQVGNFKMIYMNKDDAYKNKWDFETEFLLQKHRKNKGNYYDYNTLTSESFTDESVSLNMNLSSNNNSIIISAVISGNKFNNLYKTQNKDNILNISNNKLSEESNSSKNLYNFKSSKNVNNSLNILGKDEDVNNNDMNSNSRKSNFLFKSLVGNNNTMFLNSSNSMYKMINNPNENFENLHYDHIIETFKNSLGLILLIIDSLNNFTNMKRLDLIINDCYQTEIYYYLHNYCFNDISKKFHILDILINKLITLEELNIEINILDHITFNKLLFFINNNLSMTTLKISFFSSDATYLRQTIYKMYYQNIGAEATSIPKIINMILPYFVENLEVLFELIKKKDLKKIAVNFDTPDIIEINNSYMNTIFKFLMNLLFLVDNKNSEIQKLVILSPGTRLDSRFLPSIENILEDINFNENNKVLTELSLQLQFFMIKNIKNLITERLILLNIGDCDIYTFKELTKFLTSYKFCKKSSLKRLSISLLDSIIEFSDYIIKIFKKIFSIKIKQLYELNIYSNLLIKDNNYENLVDIFKNNWISKCRIILNRKTPISIIYLEEEKNNFNYLVSHSLEDKLLSSDELLIRNKIFFDKDKKDIIDCDKDDNIFLITWKLFNKKYKSNLKDKDKKIRSKKDIIFNTLKYLYFTKNVQIKHELKD